MEDQIKSISSGRVYTLAYSREYFQHLYVFWEGISIQGPLSDGGISAKIQRNNEPSGGAHVSQYHSGNEK